MSEHVKAVQSMYEAFGRGDVPAILETLSEDVRWDAWDDNAAQKAGVPWMRPHVGKEATVEFFRTVGTFQSTSSRCSR